MNEQLPPLPNDTSGIAVVVGGTSGFGLGITQALASNGLAVITVGRSAQPHSAWAHFVCDVGERLAWESAVDSILSKLGAARVQALIYTVGYARVFPFSQTPVEEWERHLRLNLTYIAESFPVFERALTPDARIATTGSQWSYRHKWPDLMPYITAKHALAALTAEYAESFPERRFRHYCVPTMATRGYEEVRISVLKNRSTLHQSSNPPCPADPKVIANSLVTHFLSYNATSPVMFELNAEAEIRTIIPR